MTYQVDILNPKADKLLRNLAELDLISIVKTTEQPLLAAVNAIRKKNRVSRPTLTEITKEVELERAKRYASKKKI